jgi:hypothetical protein
MPVCGRSEMAHQAIADFRAQTYENKRLLILDNAKDADNSMPYGQPDATSVWMPDLNGATIGGIRNAANWCAGDWGEAEVIINLDSDDRSHANRFSEQVALLQSSGADCVGFSDLLFWREPRKLALSEIPASALNDGCSDGEEPGEAWLYTSAGPKPAPPGTTLCYTREFWSRNPFPATSQGEELQFLSRAKVETISSLPENETFRGMYKYGSCPSDGKPRMIARIHGQNTSTAYDPRKMAAESKRKNPAWQRVPAWDSYCAGAMR